MPDVIQQVDGGLQGQLAQISMELGRQSTQLAVITTKLDDVINAKTDHETRIRNLETACGKVSDHEPRIRFLEQFKYRILGAAVGAGAVFGGASTLIYWALQAHH